MTPLRTGNRRRWRKEHRLVEPLYRSWMSGPGWRFPYEMFALNAGRWIRHTPKSVP